ncbi:MAG: threonine-phosphate decarboxylase [Deltaproteobacteria bacterium]|nr:threonine-phosphate decarboxylase [Deltaproteobacteria bacterium]
MEQANRVGVETATWSPWSKNMNKTHGGNIWKIAKESGLKPENILDFSASINPLGLSQKAEMAIKDVISLLGHYPEPGAEAMRAELASYHNLPEENILAGNGSTEFIYLLPQIFRPKKTVVVEPSFSEYRNSLESFSCGITSFNTKEDEGFVPDMTSLYSIIENGYDLVYLCNPANPSGVLLSRKDVLDVAGKCLKFGTILVVDEAFVDFVEEESVKRDAIIMDNLIVIRSMTKFFSMAGLRLGYIIANQRLIKRFEAVKPPWSANTLAILAGIESLKDVKYIKMTREWLQHEMPLFIKGFNNISFLKVYPSRINYILVKILLHGITAKYMQEELLKSGIFIRDCSSFAGLDSSFFRVAVRKREENKVLLDAVTSMLANL